MLMAFDFNHLILVSLLSSVRIGSFGHIYNLILAIGLRILGSIAIGLSILCSVTVGFSIFSSIAVGLCILGSVAIGLSILGTIIVGLYISGVLTVRISVSISQWFIVRSIVLGNLRLALFNNPVDVPFLILTLNNI